MISNEYNANDEISYSDMESMDDRERSDFGRELAKRDLARIDHGGGYTIGWLYAKNGERLDNPTTGDQPAIA